MLLCWIHDNYFLLFRYRFYYIKKKKKKQMKTRNSMKLFNWKMENIVFCQISHSYVMTSAGENMHLHILHILAFWDQNGFFLPSLANFIFNFFDKIVFIRKSWTPHDFSTATQKNKFGDICFTFRSFLSWGFLRFLSIYNVICCCYWKIYLEEKLASLPG